LSAHYPVLDNVTWPGRIPFLALTSGTTQGATKYIPVSAAMLGSNRKAAQTMLAAFVNSRPDSRLFRGRLFFLGGSTALAEPAPGIFEGDLSGIAAVDLAPLWRAFTFPPLELALETDWDSKLSRLAESSAREPITLVSGVPSWLLLLFQRVLEVAGKSTVAEVWPALELVVHGGVKFDPYRESFRSILGSPTIQLLESYPCSEGFIAYGDRNSGLLRLMFDHGLFFEFVPVDELDAPYPTRHWLATAQTGVNYAIVVSTCAGMWAHIIGDTIRFESLDPPLFAFTGRTRYTLSAFGEHLISEEVEAAMACASAATSAAVRDWHVGPVFASASGVGYHQFVVEFLREPSDPELFRDALDADLSRRNADYLAHRFNTAALPAPALIVAASRSFESWMRCRGKLGGQNKVPRMDSSGKLTADLVQFLRANDRVALELGPIADRSDSRVNVPTALARV
jgi:GH3 auxin-responsive promoter